MRVFIILNQMLGHRQLILIALVPAGVFVTTSCKFLLLIGLRYCYYMLLVDPPYQNHSSCTLTLVLLKIQLRVINIDNKKKKDKID